MRVEAIATNLRCNQNCTYCSARRPQDDLARIQPAAIRAAINAAIDASAGRGAADRLGSASPGAAEITLTGGEPTLRGDLPLIVAHAAKQGAFVTLETNATAIDPPRAAALRDAGLGRARVNLSGWGEALDAVTRDEGGFRRTIAGLHALRDAGVPIEISAAVVRSTRPLLPDLPGGLTAELGPGVVRLLRVTVPISAPDPTELVSFEEAAETILALESAGRRAGVPVRMSPEPGPPPCVFSREERAAGLFSLTRGSAKHEGFLKPAACDACLVTDRCPGLPEAYLARFPAPALRPVTEDRLRRRLSVISTVEEQIDRELVQPSRGPRGDDAIIRVNFHCNQACSFCFVSTHLPDAPDARVREAIVAAARRGDRIVLSGGEPTLHPRLASFIALAKRESAHPVQLQTNATRLDDEALTRSLVDAGLDEVFVSLHGATAEVSDAVTAAPGTFARTRLGLDHLAKTDVTLILNFVIHKRNHVELPAYVRLAAARWPKAILNLSFVAPSADVVPRTTDLIPRYTDVRASLEEALEEAARLDRTVVGFDSMCGLPLCLVPAAARPRDLVEIEPGYDGGEFLKTEACARCALDRRCYGLRRGYAELHGTSELTPL